MALKWVPKMCKIIKIWLVFLFTGSLLLCNAKENIEILESELTQVRNAIKQQAHYNYQTGTGAVGYRSKTHSTPNNTEWIKIEFNTTKSFDQVILVPCLADVSEGSIQGDAFPVAFHILAGKKNDDQGQVILTITEEDQISPRKSPAAFNVKAKDIDWIKLVATQLGSRQWDGAYLLQLSEILVFDHQENIALRQKVITSSDGKQINYGARRAEYLVDGSIPYSMDAAHGDKSLPYIAVHDHEKTPIYEVDLGGPLPVNQLVIHTIEFGDTIPQANAVDYGLPDEFEFYGANSADFSDGFLLGSFTKNSFYDCAPIIALPFEQQTIRYFKLKVTQPDIAESFYANRTRYMLGFSEIELHSRGKNILLGKQFYAKYPSFQQNHSTSLLTDGRNLYGYILPLREWLNQLAKRHELEIQEIILNKKLSIKYDEQEQSMKILSWTVFGLITALIMLFLLSRLLQMRQVTKLRQRFAADLHDELGANMHAISLLSDLAKDSANKQNVNNALIRTIDEIKSTTLRSSEAVRHSIHSLEGRSLLGKLEDNLARIARRMFDDEEYSISVAPDVDASIEHFRLKQRHDLFLFCKECLTNISRHSDADLFSVHVYVDNNKLNIEVQDNGTGLKDNAPPKSLIRRAKLLKAKLKVLTMETSKTGAHILLTIPLSQRNSLLHYILNLKS